MGSPGGPALGGPALAMRLGLLAASVLLALALATVVWRAWQPGGSSVTPLEPETPLVAVDSPEAAPPLLDPRVLSSSAEAGATAAVESTLDDGARLAIDSGRHDLLTSDGPTTDTSARLDLTLVERRPGQPDVPRPGVRLWLLQGNQPEDEAQLLGETDRSGRLLCALPKPGTYQLWIDETDIPEDLTPSHLTAEVDRVSRFFRAGTVTELEFALVEARRLAGIVLDGKGAPVDQALLGLLAVTIDPLNPRRSRELDSSVTDAGGRFVWDRLPAGEYVVSTRGRIVSSVSSGLELRQGSFSGRLLYPTFSAPFQPQVYVDLRTRSATQVELVLHETDLSTQGRVVDEAGEPVEGAEVTAIETRVLGGPWNEATPFAYLEREGWSQKANTTAEGTFEFPSVPRNALRIEVRPPTAKRVRTAVLGAPSLEPARAEFDLTTSPEDSVDLGDFVVETLQPFEVQGRIVLVGAPSAVKGDGVVFDARYPSGSFPRVDLEGKERPFSSFAPSTGAFLVRCNTPRDIVEVVVFWRSRPQDEKVFTFQPVPNETREDVVLEFP